MARKCFYHAARDSRRKFCQVEQLFVRGTSCKHVSVTNWLWQIWEKRAARGLKFPNISVCSWMTLSIHLSTCYFDFQAHNVQWLRIWWKLAFSAMLIQLWRYNDRRWNVFFFYLSYLWYIILYYYNNIFILFILSYISEVWSFLNDVFLDPSMRLEIIWFTYVEKLFTYPKL